MIQLIVADIFGRTKALEEISSKLSGSVEILDPYNGRDMGFKDEAEAYAYFISAIGMNQYSAKVKKIVQSFTEQINLIGFSVGASVIWQISTGEGFENITGATCFYGSQIRHSKTICPTFPIKLIFPTKEEHFSVLELISDLSGRKNVDIQQVEFLHGFMNRHSQNFNQAGHDQFMKILNEKRIN